MTSSPRRHLCRSTTHGHANGHTANKALLVTLVALVIFSHTAHAQFYTKAQKSAPRMGRSDPAMSSRMLSPFQASGLYRNLWQQYANDKSSQSGDTSPAILNSQYWRPSRGPFYAQLVETPGDRDTMSSFLNTVN